MTEAARGPSFQETGLLDGIEQFPDLKSLQNHSRLQLASYAPNTVIETGWHNNPDIKVALAQSIAQQSSVVVDFQYISKKYVSDIIDNIGEKCWWLRSATPQDYEGLDQAPIIAAHEVTMTFRGERLPQSYTIYEAGEASSQEDVETVVTAMAVIDQYTGGALVSNGRHPRIILYNDELRNSEYEDSYDLAITNSEFAIINTRNIRIVADVDGVNYQAALAQTIFHEIGGHQLDNQFGKEGGGYFAQFFRYKQIGGGLMRDTGIRPRCIVQSKDTSLDPSFPVNSYGSVDEYEDLATSAEQLLAEFSGLTELTNGSDYFSFDWRDRYRTDILIGLFELAAIAVGEEYGNPGFVGCEFEYRRRKNKKVTQSPLRGFTVKTTDGATAIAQEIESIIEATKKPTITFAKKIFNKPRR